MHSMQDLFFLARWVEMVYYVPNVLISATEKKHNFQNNENIALLHLNRKKKDKFYLNSHKYFAVYCR